MIDPRRSFTPEVRNPLLGLASVARIRELPEADRVAIAGLLREIAVEADAKAEAAWSKRKGPMAAYWRATCTYAKHAARAIGRPDPACDPWTCTSAAGGEHGARCVR